MKIFVDIDDTICYYSKIIENLKKDYSKTIPYEERSNKINNLYDKGHKIIYWTMRIILQKLWFNITYSQLKEWGCKFHELRMGKPI